MKRMFLILLMTSLFGMFGNAANDMAKYRAKVESKVSALSEEIKNKAIVQAVKTANSAHQKLGKSKALKEIKKTDQKWKNSVGVPGFVKKYLVNPCAIILKKIQKKLLFAAEIFVMDELGAIVCETDKTSDFWQGDEAKWQKSFNGGKGQVYLEKPKFDESTQAFVIQVSVPIFDDAKKTIGVVTYSVDLDRI